MISTFYFNTSFKKKAKTTIYFINSVYITVFIYFFILMVQWHLDFHHFPYVSNYLIVLLYGDLTTQKSDLVLCEVKFRLLNIVYRDQSSVVAVTNMEMWRIMIIHKHRDNNSIKSTYFRHYSIHLYLCKHNLFSLHVQANRFF